ncbi:protein of unknown function [Burkholderia multivorans]
MRRHLEIVCLHRPFCFEKVPAIFQFFAVTHFVKDFFDADRDSPLDKFTDRSVYNSRILTFGRVGRDGCFLCTIG